MHAVGALAGGVAHDFKNLLTVVCGQAEFAAKECPPEVARRMATILDTAERGRSMVEELLVFARKQNQRHEILELGEAVRGVEDMLRRLLREDMTLELRLPRRDVFVRADRGKIEQIIMNLIVNAQDASPAGGRVAVRVASGRLGIDRTEKLGIEPGQWAVLQVIDHGVGMDEEVLSQVFEPFYTTKGEGKGTGLGLATVQGIVHQYGGTIAVRSVPGRGTRMTVLLPLVQRGGRFDDETTDSSLEATKDLSQFRAGG
jgi:signal transduction histidine kinase